MTSLLPAGEPPVTDREMLELMAEHLVLLRRLALAGGPIRLEGRAVGKLRTIAAECDAAHAALLAHLGKPS